MNKSLALGAAVLVGITACAQDNNGITGLAADRALENAPSAVVSADAPGAVYTLTNQTAGNAVAMYARAADGSLTWLGSVATGGSGAGSSLGSQGAVALSDDGRWLFAVNAGSNDISSFAVTESGLALTSRVASGGIRPISVTVHDNVV